jgi:hypothetical protein
MSLDFAYLERNLSVHLIFDDMIMQVLVCLIFYQIVGFEISIDGDLKEFCVIIPLSSLPIKEFF